MENERMRKVPRKDVEFEENVRSPKDETYTSEGTDNTEGMTKDDLSLLAIFPEEVWIIILEKIDDATANENLCNASPFFRNLLFEKRTLFLFPKVWSILGLRHHQSEMHLKEQKAKHYNIILRQGQIPPGPPLPRVLLQCDTCRRPRYSRWYSEILKSRLVCRGWCDAIDNFYDDLPDSLKSGKMFEKTGSWLLNEFTEGNGREMGDIQRHFQNSHVANETGKCERNPFLGRRLFMLVEERVRFFNEVLGFLQKYGHHIWHFQITMNPEFPSWIYYYNLLRQVLELFPNLRTLSIKCRIFMENEGIISADELAQLKREISLNPLPTLEHLQLLRTNHVLAPVLNEMILRNNSITRLEVLHTELTSMEETIYRRPRMCGDGAFNFFEVGEGGILPQLEELTVDLKYLVGFEWRRIFTALGGKWGDTLKTLKLKLPGRRSKYCTISDSKDEVGILRESTSLRLNLFKVRHLEVDIPMMACLDFILPIKDSLETLEVKREFFVMNRNSKDDLEMKYEQQQIQFLGWTEEMNASNIWRLFPKLKKIDMNLPMVVEGIKTWTREDWEEEVKTRDGQIV